MFLYICRVCMLLFAGTAIYLLMLPDSHPRRRWAFILGLSSQPFWAILSWKEGEWSILAVTVGFTILWIKGVYINFIKPKAKT